MRAFARPTPIGRLPLEIRVVYSTFCLFMLVGLGSSAWLYLDGDLGVRATSAARSYLGAPDPRGASPPHSRGDQGPVLELPEADLVAPMRLERPARQVIETFHFHLFAVSVCLLILGHLFMMCQLAPVPKRLILGLAGVSSLLHVLTPVLIRFAGAAWGGLMFPTVAAMAATWLLLIVWPLVEMWAPRSANLGPSGSGRRGPG